MEIKNIGNNLEIRYMGDEDYDNRIMSKSVAEKFTSHSVKPVTITINDVEVPMVMGEKISGTFGNKTLPNYELSNKEFIKSLKMVQIQNGDRKLRNSENTMFLIEDILIQLRNKVSTIENDEESLDIVFDFMSRFDPRYVDHLKRSIKSNPFVIEHILKYITISVGNITVGEAINIIIDLYAKHEWLIYKRSAGYLYKLVNETKKPIE